MAISQALLVIADIGGYTRFMREHTFALAHAQDTIAQLLEAVIDAAKPLKLAKLEGDAAFLYAPIEAAAQVETLASRMPAIYRAFMEKRHELGSIGLCNCAACVNVVNLKLKFVAHAGQVAEQRVKRHSELAGVDVILVHRMLKNDVPSAEYVLMTEPVARGMPAPVREQAQAIEHDFEGLGRTATQFVELSQMVPHFPAPPPPSLLLRLWRKVCQELRSLPYSIGPKKACQNFHNVEVVDSATAAAALPTPGRAATDKADSATHRP